jgi:hypothetical protein
VKNHHSIAYSPLNLLLAFLLELFMLVIFIIFGLEINPIWALIFPLLAAVIWGIFRVDNDPGKAIVKIPGALRLVIEIGLFSLAAVCLAIMSQDELALLFMITVAIHYLISFEHVVWLLRQK